MQNNLAKQAWSVLKVRAQATIRKQDDFLVLMQSQEKELQAIDHEVVAYQTAKKQRQMEFDAYLEEAKSDIAEALRLFEQDSST